MTTRKELTEAIGARYRAAPKSDKRKILDEFVALTGCHRKHAIRALNGEHTADVEDKGRNRVYDEATRQALVMLWEAVDRAQRRQQHRLAVGRILADRATAPPATEAQVNAARDEGRA